MSEETFGNWIKIMNKTLNYYNENAQSFASGTVSVEFTEMQDKFLQKLNPGAYTRFWLRRRKGHEIFFGPRLSGRGNRRFRTVMPDCE